MPSASPRLLPARRHGVRVLAVAPPEADEGAWRTLAASAVEPNPFFEPGFVQAAHEHLEHPGVPQGVALGPGGE